MRIKRLGTKAQYYIGGRTRGGELLTLSTVQRHAMAVFPEGYTIQEAVGVWEGETEPSYVVTVYSASHFSVVTVNALVLSERCDQSCVLVEDYSGARLVYPTWPEVTT